MRRSPATIVAAAVAAASIFFGGGALGLGEAVHHVRPQPARGATARTVSGRSARTVRQAAPSACTPAPRAGAEGPPGAPVTYQYGPDPAELLDLYAPAPVPAGAPPAPLILFFHSGGWVGGSRVNIPDFVSRQVGRGWAVASVDYRLAPAAPFPAAIQDAKWATRWLKANASILDVRPDCFVAAGTSAGGHIAAMLTVTRTALEPVGLPRRLAAVDESMAGLIDVVGPTDLASLWNEPDGFGHPITAQFLQCPGPECDPNRFAAANPIDYVAPDEPPALLVYGGQDGLVTAAENGQALADAWAALVGPQRVTYELVPDQGHNIDFAPNGQLDDTLTQFLAVMSARP